MTKIKKNKEDATWKFSIDDQVLKKLPDNHNDETKLPDNKITALVLDTSILPEHKTRTELSKSLELIHDNDDDLFTLASYVKRVFSFIIDSLLVAVIINRVSMIMLILKPYVQRFFEQSQFNYALLMTLFINSLFFTICFTALFLFLVIPITFFNCSLGKKLFGLRIRGENNYTLSISQVFYRELVIKPLAIAAVVGFIIPFYSKKRQSLHDKLAHTIVIEN